MSSLLYDEPSVSVSPTLATILGLNEAIVLQQIHFWATVNRRKGRDDSHYHYQQWWSYKTYKEWHEELPFLSERTIRRALDHLVEAGAARKDRFNKKGYDKTNWYSVNHDGLALLLAAPQEKDKPERLAKVDSPSGQSDQMDVDKLAKPIPETTRDHTDISSEPQTAPTESLEEPELVPFGDDDWPEEEEAQHGLPKWRRPELPIHFEVLKACGAKKFTATSGMKRMLTSLGRAIKVGEVHGDEVYQECLEALNGKDELVLPGVPIPATWVPYRLDSAYRYHWDRDYTITALYDVEKLRGHCKHFLRKMGAKAPPAPKTYEKHPFPERGQDLTMESST